MIDSVTKNMTVDKVNFQKLLFDSISDQVDSVVLNTKSNNQKILLEIFRPLLPMACILLHLKACHVDGTLAVSDVL